ncbi:hypothetical protein BLOT_009759 [Blomia tropicalis]|nr:hypothetical protein BLOT_009759 [Blomia tropicalis]
MVNRYRFKIEGLDHFPISTSIGKRMGPKISCTDVMIQPESKQFNGFCSISVYDDDDEDEMSQHIIV